MLTFFIGSLSHFAMLYCVAKLCCCVLYCVTETRNKLQKRSTIIIELQLSRSKTSDPLSNFGEARPLFSQREVGQRGRGQKVIVIGTGSEGDRPARMWPERVRSEGCRPAWVWLKGTGSEGGEPTWASHQRGVTI